MKKTAICASCGEESTDVGIERIVLENFSLEGRHATEQLDYGKTIGYFCLKCGEDYQKGVIK